jgi:hypothetical protein
MPAIPDIGIDEILYQVVALPVETPGSPHHLIHVGVTDYVCDVVGQVAQRVGVQVRVAFALLKQLARKTTATNVVQVIGPVPCFTRGVFFAGRFEDRPEVDPGIHNQCHFSFSDGARDEIESLLERLGDAKCDHRFDPADIPVNLANQFTHALKGPGHFHQKVFQILQIWAIVGHGIENVGSNGTQVGKAGFASLRCRIIGCGIAQQRFEVRTTEGEPLYNGNMRSRRWHVHCSFNVCLQHGAALAGTTLDTRSWVQIGSSSKIPLGVRQQRPYAD